MFSCSHLMTSWFNFDRRLMALWSHVTPWEKKLTFAVQWRNLFTVDREYISGYIYSGVQIWITGWGRDDGLGLPWRTAPSVSQTDWIGVNSSLWLFGGSSCICMYLLMCWVVCICSCFRLCLRCGVLFWGVFVNRGDAGGKFLMANFVE